MTFRIVFLVVGVLFSTHTLANTPNAAQLKYFQVLVQQMKAQIPLLPHSGGVRVLQTGQPARYRTQDDVMIDIQAAGSELIISTTPMVTAELLARRVRINHVAFFRGRCPRDANVILYTYGTRNDPALAAFARSKKVSDLPYQSHLTAMRRTLLLQCGNVSSINISVQEGNNKLAAARMSEASDWHLVEATPAQTASHAAHTASKPQDYASLYKAMLNDPKAVSMYKTYLYVKSRNPYEEQHLDGFMLGGVFTMDSAYRFKGLLKLQFGENGTRSMVFPVRLAPMSGQFKLVTPTDTHTESKVTYQGSGEFYVPQVVQYPCKVPKDGHDFWGTIEMTVVEGDSSIVLVTCPNDKEDNWGQSGKTFTLNKVSWNTSRTINGKSMTTNDASGKLILGSSYFFRQFTPAVGEYLNAEKHDFDRNNALVFLGYKKSRLLFTDRGVSYYLGVFSYKNNYGVNVDNSYIVAVHDIAATRPILDVTSGTTSVFGHTARVYRYNPGLIDHMTRVIIPKLRKTLSLAEQEKVSYGIGFISHYTRNTGLKRTLDNQRLLKTTRIEPAITTFFVEKRDRNDKIVQDSNGLPVMIPKYKAANEVNTKFVFYGADQANTHKKTLARRKLEDERYREHTRRLTMTPQQIAAENKRKIQEMDARQGAKFRAKGMVYRDMSYWVSFAKYGLPLRSIFLGEFDIDESEANFPLLYKVFIEHYYLHCSANVPRGSPGYDKYQGIEGEPLYYQGSLRMKSRFWKQFQAYEAQLANDLIKDIDPGSSRDVLYKARFYQALFSTVRADIERLFNGESCDSPFIKQFEDNLWQTSKQH